MTDIRQTKQYADYIASVGWKVEKIEATYCYLKKFPLIGYFVKIQRPEKFNDKIIQKLRSKYRIFQIIVEPSDKKQEKILQELKFKQTSPYVPSKTLHVDLTKSEEKLLASFKKDARYAIRKTETLKINEEKDIKKFHGAWRKAVPLSRYVMSLSNLTSLKKSFKNKQLFLLNSEKTSGAIFLIGDKTAYYWQAFTSSDARKTLVQYRIVFEGMLWPKRHGTKMFDVEGIYDERFPQKSWSGFTHFKKSFDGEEIYFPGAYSRTMLPLRK